MRLLIDTHILLWWLQNNPNLSTRARALIIDAEEVFVSSASIWEIGIKLNLKKLTVDMTELLSAIDENGFLELPISAQHAAAVRELKNIHRDPFDRILLAQTMSEPLKFLTSDKILQKYSDLVEVV